MKREKERNTMNKFVTALIITDEVTVDFRNVVQVTGEFTFDGRMRADQRARFTVWITDAVAEVEFTVEVVKAKHTQWRSMKDCAQRDQIHDEVGRWVMSETETPVSVGEQNENESENVLENESEKELDAAILRNTEFSLNQVVAATAVKDSKDPLEIPNFLKRS